MHTKATPFSNTATPFSNAATPSVALAKRSP